jgi:sialate O-acetylesterase
LSKAENLLIAVQLIAITSSVFADVRLPAVVSDNMVLQQNSKVTLWGWADPGEKIKVKASWQSFFGKSTKADKDGKWKIAVKTPKAGGPFTITIKAGNAIILKNILSGEVWICSGQSNMEMGMAVTNNAAEEIAKADYPNIRLFDAARRLSARPLEDVAGSWVECSPETVARHGTWGGFSAVAYYFGRKLHKDLNVPIGLISSTWGGSPAQSWTPGEMLSTMPDFAEHVKRLTRQSTPQAIAPAAAINAHTPTSLYNAMIYPFIPFTIRGAIWYQGESNAGAPVQYQTLFPAMIKSWRDAWGLGDFPFYYVQIAPIGYDVNSAYLREAQFMTLSIPNVGMAVTMDISNIYDMHPKNKLDVGERLALWALAKDYGQKGLVYSGPVYKGMKIEGNKIRLSFDYIGSGLMAKDGPLTHFKIAGADKNFVDATATIEGDTIVVSSDKITSPAAVRFAFSNNDEPNLCNKEGLPASSFRTDRW